MSAITGAYAPAGQGWRLAQSLVTLAHELADKYGDQISCLGTLGNAAHVTEGYSSDHNPFIRDPAEPSIGIVRAIDLGGDPSLLLAVRQHVYDLAGAGFPPLTPYGYLKGPDSQGTPWPCGKAGFNHQPGDEGHLHISVTQVNGYSPNPNGYVAAIDSTAPWGFTGNVPSGGGELEDDMALSDADKQWINDAMRAAIKDTGPAAILAHPIDPHTVDGPDLAPGQAWPGVATLQRFVADIEVRVGRIEGKIDDVLAKP